MFILDVGVCNDPAILPFLNIVRRIIFLLQIVVPIILIIWASISFATMMMNPDEKQGLKKILNKFIAAIVVFIIPLLVDVVMAYVSQSVSSDNSIGSFSSCWRDAEEYNAFETNGYVE